MRDRIITAVEVLENMREGTDLYMQAICTLYVYSMGKYELVDED